MSIKQLVNSYDVYQDFLKYLDVKISDNQKSLEASKDLIDIYRLQGQIFALRRLKLLREEVLAAEK